MAYERQGFFQKRGSSNLSVNRTFKQTFKHLEKGFKQFWKLH